MQVPLTKNLEDSTWNLESTAWNPESKTWILYSLKWGETPVGGGGSNFFPCRFCQGLKKKNIIVQDVENLHVDQNRKKNDTCFSPLSLLFSYLFKDIKAIQFSKVF